MMLKYIYIYIYISLLRGVLGSLGRSAARRPAKDGLIPGCAGVEAGVKPGSPGVEGGCPSFRLGGWLWGKSRNFEGELVEVSGLRGLGFRVRRCCVCL